MADVNQKQSLKDALREELLPILSKGSIETLMGLFDIYDVEIGEGGGSGDMILDDEQEVTGLKTFDKDKLAVKGTGDGATLLTTVNTGADNYTVTFPAKNITVAGMDDVSVSSMLATTFAGSILLDKLSGRNYGENTIISNDEITIDATGIQDGAIAEIVLIGDDSHTPLFSAFSKWKEYQNDYNKNLINYYLIRRFNSIVYLELLYQFPSFKILTGFTNSYGTYIYIVLNCNITAGSTGFTLNVNSISVPFTLSNSNNIVTITPTTPLLLDDVITISYSSGNYTSAYGDLVAFSDFSINNNYSYNNTKSLSVTTANNKMSVANNADMSMYDGTSLNRPFTIFFRAKYVSGSFAGFQKAGAIKSMWYSGDSKIYVVVQKADTTTCTYITEALSSLTAGWHSIAITFEGGNTVNTSKFKVYIDSVLKNNSGGTGAFTGLITNDSNAWEIGNYTGVTIGSLYDNFAFYMGGCANQTQINELHNSGEGINHLISSLSAYLKAWFEFEDNLNDSVNSNNGTATTPVYSSDIP